MKELRPVSVALILILLSLAQSSTSGHPIAQSQTGIQSRPRIKTGNPPPFVIRGQITNIQGRQLIFVVREDGHNLIDTLQLDNEGRFCLKSYNVRGPRSWAGLAEGNGMLTMLYPAPGDELVFTADFSDRVSFQKSKRISGTGASINNYAFSLEKNAQDWSGMNEKDLLKYVRQDQRFSDSLYQVYFYKDRPEEPYFDYFKKMARFNNVFRKLYYLVCHADDSTGWSYGKSAAFVRTNFGNDTLLHHLTREEYLISGDYTNLMFHEYPGYLRRMDCRKGLIDCSSNKLYWAQVVRKVGAIYTGKVRQIALYQLMLTSLQHCRSFEELHSEAAVFPQFIAALGDKDRQAELQGLLQSKGTELANTQTGLDAPLFDAKDSSGKVYHIADYKGKVIYMDLWGSWCGPCRELTPYFKTLYQKYKNDDRIAFISVAVADSPDNWKKAILKDQPAWTQLLDTDGKVQSSYVANSVPKFILIDKQFRIVSFDAPMPNDTTQLHALLDKELAK